MNYKETIDYLFNIAPAFERVGAKAYKANLNNTIALDEHFGHPHKQFKTIHVAGTNGKGSCSHTIAAILQRAGYKVGLYTSPHLVDFRERIKINGKCIEEDYVVRFVASERGFFEQLSPSFFEVTTALAFKYFAEKAVDYAVIEVGLGGRLDCTNIITPILSVITNISLDHTEFLGNTLTVIASEKAGIIKECVPVIVGETTQETRGVFEKTAKERRAPIVFAEEEKEVVACEQKTPYSIEYHTKHYGKISSPLLGLYQIRNTNTVLSAVNALKTLHIINNNRAVEEGFLHVKELTGLLGRWQQLGADPTIVCDTGHNLGGWTYLAEQIKAQHCKTCRIIFGMVDDKDIDGVMALLPKDAVYYFTQASTKRAIPASIVMEKGVAHGLQGECFDSVKTAFLKAKNDADNEDFIFIGGSSYVVADLLICLNES